MAHKGYHGLSSVTVAGVSITGARSYAVDDGCQPDGSPSDDDLYPLGFLLSGGMVAGQVVTDDAAAGVARGATGSGGFTEKQGATSKAHSVANQTVVRVSRRAGTKAGRGSTLIDWVANSSDGATSPVTRPS